MDLQSHLEIGDVKFIEVFEKMPLPTDTSESVMKKVEELNKEETSSAEEKEISEEE